MKQGDFLRISTYQGPLYEGQFERNFQKTLDTLRIAEETKSDFLLMPECFWQGYFDTVEKARDNALDLKSSEFTNILKQLKQFSTILIVGTNIREHDNIYNSALIIKGGKLIGRYDKATTYPPYDYIECGREFSVFEHKGIKYGILICYDSTSFEPSRILALKGAKIVFCPLFNRVKRTEEMAGSLDCLSHQIARSAENNCWYVTSDIVCSTETEVCKGYTRIFDNNGNIVASALPFEENILTYTIPLASLKREKETRLKGHPGLFDQMNKAYKDRYEA